MDELVVVLERLQKALAVLHYRLTVLTLLLANDERRFLSRATDDLEDASEAVHALEEERKVAVNRAGMRYGLAAPLRLSVIADAAPGEQRQRLHELRSALREQVTSLDNGLRLATDLAHAGSAELRAWLERLATGHADLLYGRDGAGQRSSTPPPPHVDHRA